MSFMRALSRSQADFLYCSEIEGFQLHLVLYGQLKMIPNLAELLGGRVGEQAHTLVGKVAAQKIFPGLVLALDFCFIQFVAINNREQFCNFRAEGWALS